MNLLTFRIQDFQSIRDSGEVEIDQIACLVGKNESGKSALLKALYRLHPLVEADLGYSVTDDYPRADVDDYREEVEAGDREHAIVATATYKLEESDLKDVRDIFGPNCISSTTMILSRGYANELFHELEVDEAKAVAYVVSEADLPQSLGEQAATVAAFTELHGILKGAEQTTEVKELLNTIKEAASKGFSQYVFNQFLFPLVPKFLYFDEYNQMTGQENLGALLNRKTQNKLKPSDHPMLGLIHTSGLDLKAITEAKRTQEVSNRLEGASNRLNKRVLRYWSQNKHVRLKFDIRTARSEDPIGMREGINIWGLVEDRAHDVTTNLGSRSRGFIWFFSFLAWYEDLKKQGNPLILLLDEPGNSLHGKAQADLLEYMEKELRGQHQVIYTTHSLFMVDANHFDRVRIVQDKSIDSDEVLEGEKGTKVLTDIYDANDDSLFPLLGAMGVSIHQSLFIGPNSLIVEGSSDMLYLRCMSSVLEREGRTGLDNRWVITPVGGAGKVPTFVALLAPQKGMNLATLLDIDPSIAPDIENLYKKKLLAKKNVLTYADFTGTVSADIEDLFDREFYLQLVNEEYSTQLNAPITISDLNAQQPRILKAIEEYLSSNPLKKGQFGHFRPARYLSENLSTLTASLSEATKNHFGKVFEQLNGLLE